MRTKRTILKSEREGFEMLGGCERKEGGGGKGWMDGGERCERMGGGVRTDVKRPRLRDLLLG